MRIVKSAPSQKHRKLPFPPPITVLGHVHECVLYLCHLSAPDSAARCDLAWDCTDADGDGTPELIFCKDDTPSIVSVLTCENGKTKETVCNNILLTHNRNLPAILSLKTALCTDCFPRSM